MKLKGIYAAGAGLMLMAGSVRSQTPGAIQQVDNDQQRRGLVQSAKSYQDGDSAPELYPEESADVGPQSVLKVHPRRTLFEAMADVQYFYTDNMFLNEHDRQKADVLVSTVEFAFAPTAMDVAGGKLAPRIGYEHQWFDFGLANKDVVPVLNFKTDTEGAAHLNRFDFNAQTAFADAQWSRGNWMFDAGFDFRRLLSTSDYEEFYTEYVPHWGAQYLVPICQHASLSLGYVGDYRFGDPKPVTFTPFSSSPFKVNPDLGDRTDHALFVTLNHALCSHAVLQPYYQLKYTSFTGYKFGRRNDLLSAVGAALYWTLCPNCELRIFADYNMRFSDNTFVSEYHQFDGGGGVNVTFRF